MKRVLITGGSRGIGAGCVIAAMGCRVAFVYMESKTEAAFLAQKTGAMPIRADISNPEAALGAVAQAADALGALTCWSTTPGLPLGLFTELSDQDWDVLCGTNLSGTITSPARRPGT